MSVDLVVSETRSLSREAEAGLDRETLRRLDIAPGEYVQVEGRDRTVAFAATANVAADGVALGDSVRTNAAVEAGDRVTVSKADVAAADRLTVAPTRGVEVDPGELPLARSLNGRPVSAGDVIEAGLLDGALTVPFAVVSTQPEGPVVVTDETTVVAREDSRGAREGGWRPATFDDVGGMADTVAELERAVRLPLERPDRFESLGQVSAPGVLLTGPAGGGKTLLARALATEVQAHVVWLAAGAVTRRRSPEVDQLFEHAVREARAHAPSLVVMDDLDAVVPDHDRASDRDRRVATHFRDLVDAVADEPGIALLATAAAPGRVDASLRRGGRLDREIAVPVPDADDRLDILEVHTRRVPLADDVDLEALAAQAHGYVGADLRAVISTAVRETAARLEGGGGSSGVTGEITGEATSEVTGEITGEATSKVTAQVTATALERALDAVEPSAMRDVQVSVPDVGYDDIGGLARAKRELVRSVEWPMRFPELFDLLDTDPPQGVLLYGPPGTGKTMLARAVANATEANFIPVKGPEVLDKFVGESERAVRDLFDRARQHAPSVVFFDEVDAIAPRRGRSFGTHAVERVVSQLLTELDGLEPLEDVVVLAATNRPDVIDPALLRPGRLEQVVEVPLPDRTARREIFAVHTREVPTADLDLDALADATTGYTGSDIAAVVREASLLAIEEFVTGDRAAAPTVTAEHLARALVTVEPAAERTAGQFGRDTEADERAPDDRERGET